MVYNPLIKEIYWGYNQLTNLLLTSWDIQVQALFVLVFLVWVDDYFEWIHPRCKFFFWQVLYYPRGSMYGIFTYISYKTSTKCRLIYHTLILWVYAIKMFHCMTSGPFATPKSWLLTLSMLAKDNPDLLVQDPFFLKQSGVRELVSCTWGD